MKKSMSSLAGVLAVPATLSTLIPGTDIMSRSENPFDAFLRIFSPGMNTMPSAVTY